MAKLLESLKRRVRGKTTTGAPRKRRRRDPYSGSLMGDEVAKASPERAGELAGHAVERVDT